MRLWLPLLLGCLLGGFVSTPDVWATRMVPLTIEHLAREAALVVQARVVSLEATRDVDGRVFTRVGLQVLDVWKGELPANPCEVVAGGGILGDRSVAVAGQAVYTIGEEAVAFLVLNPAGEWVTLGLAQGRFEVRREPGTGRAWVSNLFWGDGAASPGLAGGARLPTQRPLTLAELKRRTQEVRR